MRIYEKLARIVDAYQRCKETHNVQWEERHWQNILDTVKENFPHGSGFDSGTTIDLTRSTGDKLIFLTSFHHMNEHGSYDGWTEHEVWVRPSMISGINLRITGRDRNDIKDYIAVTFDIVLQARAE